MDQPETRVETCDVVTSDLSSCISSGTDPVSTVSAGDKALAPPPQQDSTSVLEPGSCQDGKVLSDMTPDLTVSEPASQIQRIRRPKPKPKPCLSRASRSTQRDSAEGVTSPAEMFSDPVKADIQATVVESQISTEKDFIPEAPSEPEPEERNSELGEGHKCTSVLSGEEKIEDVESGKRTCTEDEKNKELLQTHRYTRKDL